MVDEFFQTTYKQSNMKIYQPAIIFLQFLELSFSFVDSYEQGTRENESRPGNVADNLKPTQDDKFSHIDKAALCNSLRE